MDPIGLFYGSTEGTTEMVSQRVVAALQSQGAEVHVHAVESATAADLIPYTHLILASSTWDDGQLQEDWDVFIDVLADTDLNGKTVAFIGTGDARSYPDTFVDAIGIIYEQIRKKGCLFAGQWPATGYRFEESRALWNGKFLGLILDEVNESELTDNRIAAWIVLLEQEGFIESTRS